MYQEINPQQTRNVSMVRHGWFDPKFDLTDGTNLYGRLKYDWIMRRDAYAEAAGFKWKFKSPLFLRNGIDILDENGNVIGEAWRETFSWKINMELNNGFKAVMYRPSFFTRERIWESPPQGTILTMRSHLFSFRDDFEITSTIVPPETIALLILLSSHIVILLRRRRSTMI